MIAICVHGQTRLNHIGCSFVGCLIELKKLLRQCHYTFLVLGLICVANCDMKVQLLLAYSVVDVFLKFQWEIAKD